MDQFQLSASEVYLPILQSSHKMYMGFVEPSLCNLNMSLDYLFSGKFSSYTSYIHRVFLRCEIVGVVVSSSHPKHINHNGHKTLILSNVLFNKLFFKHLSLHF